MIKKIKEFKKEVKNYLMANLDNFEFIKKDTHYDVYDFQGERINIWTSNGKGSVSFYKGFNGVEVEVEEKDKKKLWKMVEATK